jgi:uncharacterized protein
MFRIGTFSNIAEVPDQLLPFLCRNEAQNCWPIGMLNEAVHSPDLNPLECLWCVVAGDDVVGAAWVTKSSRFLGLTEMPYEAVPVLIDAASARACRPTGIAGPCRQGERFCKGWTERHGVQVTSTISQRIYQLEVVSPMAPSLGTTRVADEADRNLLEAWGLQFSRDCHMETTAERNREAVTKAIRLSSCYFWVIDGKPVSMAEVRGPTPSGIRISNVYTPLEFRRRGYATALVAAVSQKMLDAGRQFCVLFTDLANPTSNSIYHKIGYRPVCNHIQYVLQAN